MFVECQVGVEGLIIFLLFGYMGALFLDLSLADQVNQGNLFFLQEGV